MLPQFNNQNNLTNISQYKYNRVVYLSKIDNRCIGLYNCEKRFYTLLILNENLPINTITRKFQNKYECVDFKEHFLNKNNIIFEKIQTDDDELIIEPDVIYNGQILIIKVNCIYNKLLFVIHHQFNMSGLTQKSQSAEEIISKMEKDIISLQNLKEFVKDNYKKIFNFLEFYKIVNVSNPIVKLYKKHYNDFKYFVNNYEIDYENYHDFINEYGGKPKPSEFGNIVANPLKSKYEYYENLHEKLFKKIRMIKKHIYEPKNLKLKGFSIQLNKHNSISSGIQRKHSNIRIKFLLGGLFIEQNEIYIDIIVDYLKKTNQIDKFDLFVNQLCLVII
jgi:hypothetical protein